VNRNELSHNFGTGHLRDARDDTRHGRAGAASVKWQAGKS